jgi:hypothetical protein
MTLFSWLYESKEIEARDLRAESVLSPILLENGLIRSVEVVETYAECLAICNNNAFGIFDLRASRSDPLIEKVMYSPPLFAKMTDKDGPVYAIAGCKSRLNFLDLRMPESMKTIVYQDAKGEVDTRGLALSPALMAVALSHEGGISICGPSDWGPIVLPKLVKFGNNVANTRAMLWHDTQFSLSFVHDRITIVRAGEKGSVR